MYDRLSEGDLQKIEAEIEYRKLVLRKELAQKIKEAAEQGDRSENFEYYAAKREKNRNESRIRYLDKMVRTAKVIHDHSAEDQVGLNNTVRVWFEEDEEEEVYRIVTTIREDSINGLISIESPVGKALMGHRVGDVVSVKVSDSYQYELKILEIKKTTDESGDEIAKY